MSPLEAWLYLDEMDLSHYWPEAVTITWDDFSEKLKEGKITLEDCSFLSLRQIHAFRLALDPQSYLPPIPSIDVPQPVAPDLFALNEPDENAPVLVTSNSRLTFDVLTALWAQGITPAYFLLIDCLGSTVDMAMIYGNFTPERLNHALGKSNLGSQVSHKKLIIPGLAGSLATDFQKIAGWEVEIGPVCAAEIPLFLGDRWIPPDEA